MIENQKIWLYGFPKAVSADLQNLLPHYPLQELTQPQISPTVTAQDIIIAYKDEANKDVGDGFLEDKNVQAIACHSMPEKSKATTSYILLPCALNVWEDHFKRLLASGARKQVVAEGWSIVLALHQLIHESASFPPVTLTEKEMALLLLLLSHKGCTVTRESLLQAVWGYDRSSDTHTVETHMYRLRQKLEPAGNLAARLKTVADGYFFSAE